MTFDLKSQKNPSPRAHLFTRIAAAALSLITATPALAQEIAHESSAAQPHSSQAISRSCELPSETRRQRGRDTLRALHPEELDFLRTWFGNSLRYHEIQVGHRRRNWGAAGTNFSGSTVYFASHLTEPTSCDGGPSWRVDLQDPQLAGLFVHEVFHVWQRQRKLPVTLARIIGGPRHWSYYRLGGKLEEAAARGDDPVPLFRAFQVEGQAEFFGNLVDQELRARRKGEISESDTTLRPWERAIVEFVKNDPVLPGSQ